MQSYIWISIFVLLLIVVGALVVIATAMRKSSVASIQSDQELHPRGYWVSLGISIGAGFGVALGLVFDNLALGIAMGVGIGVAIGSALEQKNKGNLRPLTAAEKQVQKRGVIIGIVVAVLGLLAFVALLLFSAR